MASKINWGILVLILAVLFGYTYWSNRDNYHTSSRERISYFGVSDGIVTQPVYLDAYGKFQDELKFLNRLLDARQISPTQHEELTRLMTDKMSAIELRYREFVFVRNGVVLPGEYVAIMHGQQSE